MGRYMTVLALILTLFSATPMRGEPIHVVILGDSNTWLGGDDCSKPKGWNTWFNKAFGPASCHSYARSGATWTNTVNTKRNTLEDIGKLGDDNVIYNQICRLQEAVGKGIQPVPQLIIIAAGINDAWFIDQRPKALSQTADEAFATDDVTTGRAVNTILTLASSIRYGCELLRAAYPEARLVLLTPAQATKVTPQLLEQTASVMEGCAQKMGIDVIRMDRESDIRLSQEKRKPTLTSDGVHTNEEGARRNGYLVARRIQAMLKK